MRQATKITILCVFTVSVSMCFGGNKGIHLSKGRALGNWPWRHNDSAGYVWDIYTNGMVNDGTSDAYDGGMRLQLGGANFNSNTARVNEGNTEIEIGPWNHGQIRVWRRVYVDIEKNYCRWIDIFENTSNTKQTAQVRYYSNMGTLVNSVRSSSGGSGITPEDWGLVISMSGGSRPNIAQVLASPKSKFIPRCQYNMGNDNVYYNANLEIKPGKAAALCLFHAQRRSMANAQKFLEDFDHTREIRMVPAPLRRIIANFSTGSYLGGIHLERSDAADKIVESTGDMKFGRVLNDKFVVDTFFDTIEIPAEKVIGMVLPQGAGDARLHVAMTNGQILCGTIKGQKLKLKMSVGSTLEIPFDRIKQWSYKISKQRPEEIEFTGPLAILRTGDSLAFDPADVELNFRTRYGSVELSGEDLFVINMDNPGHGLHKAEFLNGSRLGGVLEAGNITLKLTLGPRLRINRNLVAKLQFSPEEGSPPPLTGVKMTNGDELFGRLGDKEIVIRTDYGSQVTLHPRSIKTMTFSTTHLGRAVVQLWDGSVLRGQLTQDELRFEIKPGPQLAICPNQCLSITRPQALPPEEVMEKIEKLVGQLGAESYKDRQDATEELVAMGKEIVPLLQKYLKTNDPEVQQRIRHVIERLGGEAKPSGGSSGRVFSPIK